MHTGSNYNIMKHGEGAERLFRAAEEKLQTVMIFITLEFSINLSQQSINIASELVKTNQWDM